MAFTGAPCPPQPMKLAAPLILSFSCVVFQSIKVLICFLGNYQNNFQRSCWVLPVNHDDLLVFLTTLKQLHPKGIVGKKK